MLARQRLLAEEARRAAEAERLAAEVRPDLPAAQSLITTVELATEPPPSVAADAERLTPPAPAPQPPPLQPPSRPDLIAVIDQVETLVTQAPERVQPGLAAALGRLLSSLSSNAWWGREKPRR